MEEIVTLDQLEQLQVDELDDAIQALKDPACMAEQATNKADYYISQKDGCSAAWREAAKKLRTIAKLAMNESERRHA